MFFLVNLSIYLSRLSYLSIYLSILILSIYLSISISISFILDASTIVAIRSSSSFASCASEAWVCEAGGLPEAHLMRARSRLRKAVEFDIQALGKRADAQIRALEKSTAAQIEAIEKLAREQRVHDGPDSHNKRAN